MGLVLQVIGNLVCPETPALEHKDVGSFKATSHLLCSLHFPSFFNILQPKDIVVPILHHGVGENSSDDVVLVLGLGQFHNATEVVIGCSVNLTPL